MAEWTIPIGKTVYLPTETSNKHRPGMCFRCGRYGHFRAQCNAAMYKTRLCWHWSSGSCMLGRSCTFAHGEAELRSPQARPFESGA